MLLAVTLLFASITDPIVNFAVDVTEKLGLWGIFILMVPESALIPIPSEATMLFAGFNVSRGTYTLWQAVLVGSIANVVGSWIAYAIGYFGRIDLIEKHGRKLHIQPHHLQLTDRWFERHGAATVFWARCLPIVRTFISLPAGVAKMPFWKFTAYTFAGCVPWMLMLTLIGRAAGDNWENWKDNLHYVDYAMALAILAAIAYLVITWWRRRGRTSATDAQDAANSVATHSGAAAPDAPKS
ncbi:MAG: DedA family protein [Actinobacteria bacterium]|nr:DedA family protein [Actinomycetota bacterium]